MRKFILTIDQGTSSSRVTVYNNSFNVVDTIQKELKQFFPNDGWVEHDALEIWDDVKNLISKILKKNKLKGSQILSIGITNQRETTVLWDKTTGKPIYKAIVWQDRRTTKICSTLNKKKLSSKIQKTTGLIIDPYFSATKIKWILTNIKNAKIILKKNNLLFGTIDTWLLWNLTEGKSHLTDITNASRTMLFDPKKEKWSEELLSFLKIPSKILPKVVGNTYDFGETCLFGEPIKVGGMAGDQQSASIGQACFHKGQSKSTYGTGCFLLMNIGRQFNLSKNRLLTTVAYKIGKKKMYCLEGSIFIAGSAIQWLRDKLFFFKESIETDKLYSNANKTEKIIFVPALTGLGAPHWQPNVRGAIFGLTRNTSIAEIVKATIDSLSFQSLDLIESMQKDAKIKIKEIRVDGGMINNNNFVQSLSNVTQIDIIKPKNTETTSLGAAYLAGLQAGILKNTQQIEKLWKKNKIFQPKMNKNIIKEQTEEWRKTIALLINIDSSKN